MLPEETVRSSTNAALAGWVADGYVRATDGKVINFDLVEEEVTRWKDECEDLREVAFDPWHGSALSQHLIDAGVNMIEVRAIIRDMSGPTKTLDAIIRDERFHHDGNPCLAWMFSNVVAHYDAKSNVYPRRERENDPNCKIDGAIASIMAMSRLELLAADDGTVLMSVPAWRNFPDGHGGMDVKCIGNNGAFWSSDGAKAD
jgi:phage terminase large subunit-like protein